MSRPRPLRALLRALPLAAPLALAGPADAGCRLALALAVDVSGSVNRFEYELQYIGLANALTDPGVTEAIFAIEGETVSLAVYEWSGPGFQRVLEGWTELTSPDAVAKLAARLRSTQRVQTDPSTAIGTAMLFGAGLMAEAPPCHRTVIDISSDGKSNTGPHPKDVTLPPQIMVNVLAIGGELIDPGELRHVSVPELTAYFRAYVARGPEAFVEVAVGFSEFQEAMIRKLKRELLVLAVSQAEPEATVPRDGLGDGSHPRRAIR